MSARGRIKPDGCAVSLLCELVVHDAVQGLVHVGLGGDVAGLDQTRANALEYLNLLGARNRVDVQVGAVHDDLGGLVLNAGLFLHDLHGLFGVLLGPGASVLVHVHDDLRGGRVGLNELLGGVQEAEGVEVQVAVEEHVAALHLGGSHNRVQAAPRVDLAVVQGGAAVGVLQVLNVHVGGGNAGLLEGLQEQEVGVGTLGDGHALTPQVGDLGDARVLAGDERRPLGLRVEADDLDGGAARAGQQRRRARGGTDVDVAAAQRLVGLVRAGGLDPLNLLALGGQGGLEPALLADNQRERVVGGVVNGHGVLAAAGRTGGVGGAGTLTGATAEQGCEGGGCGQGLEGGTARRGESHDGSFRF